MRLTANKQRSDHEFTKHLLEWIREHAMELPEERIRRLEALRDQVRRGIFQVSAIRAAQRILEEALTI